MLLHILAKWCLHWQIDSLYKTYTFYEQFHFNLQYRFKNKMCYCNEERASSKWFRFHFIRILSTLPCWPKGHEKTGKEIRDICFSASKLKTLLARKSLFFLTDYVRYINTDWALYDLVVFCSHLSILELRQKRTQLSQLINLSWKPRSHVRTHDLSKLAYSSVN